MARHGGCWGLVGVVAIGLLALSPATADQPAVPSSQQPELVERNRLWKEATRLLDEGNSAEALKIAQQVLAIEEKVLGPDDRALISTWGFVARCAENLEDWPTAETARDHVVRITTLVGGPEHWRVADARRSRKRTDRLRQLSKEDLAALRNAERVSRQLSTLAQTDRAGAIAAAAEILKLFEKLFGPEHPDTATAVGNLGVLHRDQANYRTADPLFERAIGIRMRGLGANHPDTANSLEGLASSFDLQGKYAAAEPLYRRAIAINARALGLDHPDTARCLTGLSVVYRSQGNLSGAEVLLLRALRIYQKAAGPEDPRTVTILNNLGRVYAAQGNFAAAEPLYQQALSVWQKTLGPEHNHTMHAINNLAALYRMQGNYGAAEGLYTRVLHTMEKIRGPEHPDTAAALISLAELDGARKKHAAAESRLKEALKILEHVFGPEHVGLAKPLDSLAATYAVQGHYAAAEPLIRRALAISEKTLGGQHPATAVSIYNLAMVYLLQGDYAAAEPLLVQSLAINEQVFGLEHPTTAANMNRLGLLRWLKGDSKLAQANIARALDVRLRHLEQTSSIQTEVQQFLMSASIREFIYLWLAVTSDEPGDATAAWQRVLAWKGATTTRQSRLREALKDDPTYAEFRRVSQQLSTVSLNPPAPPEEQKELAAWNERAPQLRRQWLEQKAQLQREHARLEKELSRKSAAARLAHDSRSITPEVIQSALAKLQKSTALVDIVQYKFPQRKDKGEPAEWRFAAFIARPGKVTRVELGSTERIQEEIKAWRETFGANRGEHDSGRELRRLLWEPLAAELVGVELVLVSPDGNVAQLPWGALPGDKPGTYLIEERSIAVIPVPQLLPELMERERASGPPATLLVAGDIDYGGDPGTPADLLAKREAAGRMQFARLAAAQGELSSIRDWYEQAEGTGTVDVLRRRQATESAFRKQAPGYDWLHLITHGFFAPPELNARLAGEPLEEEIEVAPDDRDPAEAGIGAALEVKEGHCLVTQIVAGGAAERDGRLKVGDQIVAVAPTDGDWTSVVGKELAGIVALIRGPLETSVRLKVLPAGKSEEIEIALARAALPAPPKPKPPTVHPGVRSGLAFAGANLRPEAGKDDGILTALEVAALDLSRVDTVVLSACETGLGQTTGGEGLLGLQRSFQVAGAKTVVATLWKVPNAATSRLMQRFYENLWDKKMSKLAALREAQTWMMHDAGNRGLVIDDHPAEAATLPPFYWAAFVLSGDWR